MTSRCSLVLVASVLLGVSQAFYLPGLAPVTYCTTPQEGKCQVGRKETVTISIRILVF